MRIGILTSVAKRHRHFARVLRRRAEVVAVAYEDVGYDPSRVECSDLTPAESGIVAEHFAERARQETVFFGRDCDLLEAGNGVAVRHLTPGMLNTSDTLAFLASARVDMVAVFGTNLIRRPLLSQWSGRIVNLHLGLSPYYRGTATNFYPLLNEEPEFVGATIHLLDEGIDSGPILRHVRPEIVANDMPHTIGAKGIVGGIEAMCAVLQALEQGTITAVPQWNVRSARLYLRKDYHPLQVVRLHEQIDAGLIERYVDRAARVANRVKLVEG